ncbi:MAG TPA: 50S ribosomal protein L4 [Syntrophales bacterium]|nr:50S ribosomal protein L4 [Syntrophales bacterium]
MKIDVVDINGKKIKEIQLPASIFEAPINVDLMHQAYVRQLANARLGTHETKTRGEVSGGGRKPWRQKGTGRARAGSIRSPLWRGGGIIFGPRPRDYSFKLPKKVRKAALCSALSMKVREDRLLILRDFPLEQVKTKAFKTVLDRLGLGSALFVLDKENPILEKSSRNLKEVKMMKTEGINVYDILKYDALVLMEPSVKKIEGALLS